MSTLTQEEFEEWVKASELPPLISEGDVGKQGTIEDIAWADTRYGKRLRVSIKFENDEVKNALLSKLYARGLAKEFGLDLMKWIGKKVKIENVLTPRGVKKPIPTAVKE